MRHQVRAAVVGCVALSTLAIGSTAAASAAPAKPISSSGSGDSGSNSSTLSTYSSDIDKAVCLIEANGNVLKIIECVI